MLQVYCIIRPASFNTRTFIRRLLDPLGLFGLNVAGGQVYCSDHEVCVEFSYSMEEYSPATTVIGAEDVYLYRGCLRVGHAYAPWSGEVDFPPSLVWRTSCIYVQCYEGHL